MKKRHYQIIFLLFFITLVAVSCSSGNRIAGGSSKKCGCGLNRGFVGY